MRASVALFIFIFPPVARAVAGRHYRRNYSLQRHLSLSQSSPITGDQAPDSLDSLELDEGSSFDGTGNTQPCSQGWSTPFDSSQRTSCDGGDEAEHAAVADEVDGGEAAVVQPGEEEDLVHPGTTAPCSPARNEPFLGRRSPRPHRPINIPLPISISGGSPEGSEDPSPAAGGDDLNAARREERTSAVEDPLLHHHLPEVGEDLLPLLQADGDEVGRDRGPVHEAADERDHAAQQQEHHQLHLDVQEDQGGAEPLSQQEFSFSPVQLPIPQSSPSTDSTSSTTNTSHTVQIFYADDAEHQLPACELRDVDPFQTTIADLERVLRENLMAKEPLIRIKLLESEDGVPVPGNTLVANRRKLLLQMEALGAADFIARLLQSEENTIIRDVGRGEMKVRLLPKDETPLLRLEEAVTLPDFSTHAPPEKESQAFDHVGEEDSTEQARTEVQRVDVEQYLARVWETAADDETRGRLMNAHELYVSKQTKNALEAWRLSRAPRAGPQRRGAEEQKAGNDTSGK